MQPWESMKTLTGLLAVMLIFSGNVFAQRPSGGATHGGGMHGAENDRWVGHETGRSDPNYHLDHLWEHGHFPGAIGAGHVWRLHGGDPGRFAIGDHIGWYLAYNVRLGTYVHVMYMGG